MERERKVKVWECEVFKRENERRNWGELVVFRGRHGRPHKQIETPKKIHNQKIDHSRTVFLLCSWYKDWKTVKVSLVGRKGEEEGFQLWTNNASVRQLIRLGITWWITKSKEEEGGKESLLNQSQINRQLSGIAEKVKKKKKKRHCVQSAFACQGFKTFSLSFTNIKKAQCEKSLNTENIPIETNFFKLSGTIQSSKSRKESEGERERERERERKHHQDLKIQRKKKSFYSKCRNQREHSQTCAKNTFFLSPRTPLIYNTFTFEKEKEAFENKKKQNKLWHSQASSGQ